MLSGSLMDTKEFIGIKNLKFYMKRRIYECVYWIRLKDTEKGGNGMLLFALTAAAPNLAEEIPPVLPLLLGFLLALVVLNLVLSFFRKKGADDHKKLSEDSEEKRPKS